jgi:diketogulonate reductase-like aldo/keto reductase
VNQVELHPYFPQAEQRAVHDQLGVRTESWGPLGQAGQLLHEPVITAIAGELDRTPAQVVLRWHLQLGSVPLPKAASPGRQAENLAVFDFELDEAQVAAITALGRPDGRLGDSDPATHEEF